MLGVGAVKWQRWRTLYIVNTLKKLSENSKENDVNVSSRSANQSYMPRTLPMRLALSEVLCRLRDDRLEGSNSEQDVGNWGSLSVRSRRWVAEILDARRYIRRCFMTIITPSLGHNRCNFLAWDGNLQCLWYKTKVFFCNCRLQGACTHHMRNKIFVIDCLSHLYHSNKQYNSFF